jgi:hypothetical protein
MLSKNAHNALAWAYVRQLIRSEQWYDVIVILNSGLVVGASWLVHFTNGMV